MSIKITILGKVPKGDDVRASFADWKEEYITKITRALPEANILHGDHIRDDAGPELVVGHDLWTVKNADIVIVDAREKIGAGTAQEMLMAKYFNRPLVSVIPRDTHHRRSNITFNGVLIKDWIHPFLDVCSDYVAESIDDAAAWAKRYTDDNTHQKIKDITVFTDAIDEFTTKLPDMVKKYQEKGW